jgi:hypothetical protein
MRNHPSPKLSLSKSTLRALGGRELRRTAGGGSALDVVIASEWCDPDLRLISDVETHGCLRG